MLMFSVRRRSTTYLAPLQPPFLHQGTSSRSWSRTKNNGCCAYQALNSRRDQKDPLLSTMPHGAATVSASVVQLSGGLNPAKPNKPYPSTWRVGGYDGGAAALINLPLCLESGWL